MHFYASSEGKRWETDGHNIDIKVQREHAMRAGMHSHVAQLHLKQKVSSFFLRYWGQVQPCLSSITAKRLSSTRGEESAGIHDFELHVNGDIGSRTKLAGQTIWEVGP